MPRETVTFATFNLLNLTARGRGAYGEPPLSDAQHDRRIAWIGAMLARIGADAVAVQELWDPAPLEEALGAAGMADSHVVLFPPDAEPGATIHNGAVVRRDMVEPGDARWVAGFPPGFGLRAEGWRELPDGRCPPREGEPPEPAFDVSLGAYSRPVLRFTLRLGEGREDVEVMACHLKSKRPTPIECDAWFEADAERLRPHRDAIGSALSAVRRTAEAAALRAEANLATKGRGKGPLVVMGDVNDGPGSSVMDILTGDPSLGGPAMRLVEEGAALFSVQAIQEARSLRDVFYTYLRKGVHASLDNILVSEEFYDWSARRDWVMEEMHVHNDHLNRTWGGRTTIESDHGIVRARFRWAPMRA